jgi:hypothetical protein
LQERIAAGIDKQNQGVFGSRKETSDAKKELQAFLNAIQVIQ